MTIRDVLVLHNYKSKMFWYRHNVTSSEAYNLGVTDFPHFASLLIKFSMNGNSMALLEFTQSHHCSFKKLKSALADTPIIALHRAELSHSIDSDASNLLFGWCIFRKKSGNPSPFLLLITFADFFSRKYSAGECKCMAIVWVVQALQSSPVGCKY